MLLIFKVTGGKMNKTKFNIQDQFLNQVRKDGTAVVIETMTGEKIDGNIRGFDSFCILMEGDKQYLVYKHAVSNIQPRDVDKVRLGTHD